MNKRFFNLVVAVIITIFFAACEKENNSEIESKEIATVKMRIEATKPSEGIYGIVHELASVKYENNILELNFPANIPDEYLGEYFWSNSENIIPEGVIISEPQVKVGLMSVIAYNDAGNNIGYFVFSSDTNPDRWITNMWYAQYI
jgi:hypothetical protein